MAMYTEQAGVAYDELIAGAAVPLLTKNVTLAAVTASYARGTVLALDEAGKAVIAGAASTAAFVLAEAVEAAGEDLVVTVYTSGEFNANKMTVADGDTVAAHAEQLRSVGIYLSELH